MAEAAAQRVANDAVACGLDAETVGLSREHKAAQLELVANDVILAKRQSQDYDEWLQIFVSKCHANKLWHEVWEEQTADGMLCHRYTTEDNKIDHNLVAARVAAMVSATETVLGGRWPVLGEVLAVCGQHKDEFFDCAFQHEKYQGEVATLKAQVVTLKEEKRSVETQVVTLTTDLATSRARVAELEQANRTRQRQRRQRRRARENADWAREQAEMKEAWDAEQPITAEQSRSNRRAIAEMHTTEQEAKRVAEFQARKWEELVETDSEEHRRVVEEKDALLERMFSGMEV